MDILFVYSTDIAYSRARSLSNQIQIQLGISYVSSLLKAHGHSTRLAVLSKMLRSSQVTLDRYIELVHPRVICFTAVYSEFSFIAGLAHHIRLTQPSIYLVVGGAHATLNPNLITTSDFDALCIGEGEYPTLELVTQLDQGAEPSGIPNLWIKHGAELERNPTRPFLTDFDSLPLPDRDMWQEWIEDDAADWHIVLAARGCPFSCTYCCHHAFRTVAQGRYDRYRSPQSIAEEVRQLTVRFPKTREVYLEVETAMANKPWFIDLCSHLQRLNETLARPLTFGTNVRVTPGADLEDLFSVCKRSGFRFVQIGLESGSETIRREVLRRDYHNEDVIRAVSLARKHGLKVGLYNMVGIPGETPAHVRETVAVNRLCQPDWLYVTIFYPYPGTDLFRLCEEQHLLPPDIDFDLERDRPVLDLPGFTRSQIHRSYIWFEWLVYRGHRPVHLILPRVLLREMRSHTWLWPLWLRFRSTWPARRAKWALSPKV